MECKQKDGGAGVDLLRTVFNSYNARVENPSLSQLSADRRSPGSTNGPLYGADFGFHESKSLLRQFNAHSSHKQQISVKRNHWNRE